MEAFEEALCTPLENYHKLIIFEAHSCWRLSSYCLCFQNRWLINKPTKELEETANEFNLLVKMNTKTQQDQSLWGKKYAEIE